MKPLAVVVAAALAYFTPASAGEVERITIAYEDGEYRVEVDARLDAPVDAVYAVLIDYARWAELNTLIEESYIEEVSAPDLTRVRMVSEGCVLFFCKRIDQVQWMRTAPEYHISAEVIPELSDLRSGWARTRLVADGESTRFYYEMALVPDFWVPPIIGPMVIRSKLREQAVETAVSVEARAKSP